MRPSRLFYGLDAERVADPQQLIPDESLLGWIARTTIENELPNIGTILCDIGQVHRNRSADVMSGPVDLEGLAVILGSDLPTVEKLRVELLGDGRARYLKSTVASGDVHTRERRFAPASLALGDIPVYRASWLLRTFPICTASWQVLRSDCTCESAQTWATVSSLTLCENCGDDLRDLPGQSVPDDQRPGLQLLADVLFDDHASRAVAMATLPMELRTLDGGEIFELALVIARIVDPTLGNPRDKVWREQPARLAQALSVAGDLLGAWPDTPWRALQAAGNVRKMLPRCDALKSLQRILSGDYRRRLPATLARQFDGMRSAITFDDDAAPEDLVDLDEAVLILGASKRTIRAARAAGEIECLFAIRHGEVVTAYSRAELQAIAATRDWPAASTVAHRIGLPPYGVEQLCAMDELVWAKAPHRTLKPSLTVRPESAREFENALRKGAISASCLENPVTLTAVMRGVGGREKAWGPVLRGLRHGDWKYALVQDGCCVRSIIVDRKHVEAIRFIGFSASDWPSFPFTNTLTQSDACDILNVPLRARAIIERYKVGEKGGAWLFDRSSISRIAREAITSSELCAHRMLVPKTAIAAVRRARLTPREFGFDRRAAKEKFEAELNA